MFQLPPGFHQTIRDAKQQAQSLVAKVFLSEVAGPDDLPDPVYDDGLPPLDAIFPQGAPPDLWSPVSQTPWENLQQLKTWAATLDMRDEATGEILKQIKRLESAMGPPPHIRLVHELFAMLLGMFGARHTL